MEKVTTTVKRRKREELHLPTLCFIVADDWMDKLGAEAFCTWLKLYTYVNRADKDRTHDIIPRSLAKLAEQLNMSKSTFYNVVVKPLWNYGLIDIIEYGESSSLGQKPKNIIVYPCPFNNPETRTQPLTKVRDYDTEYISICKEFGKLGGQPQHKVKTKKYHMNTEGSSYISVSEATIDSPCLNTIDTSSPDVTDAIPSHSIEKESFPIIIESEIPSVPATEFDTGSISVPPSMENEPGEIEQAVPTPGTESEHPPVSDLYPIIEVPNTNIIKQRNISTCVYKSVEKDFNRIEEFKKTEKEWLDCFETPLSYQGYCDLARLRDSEFISKTIRAIKIHEGEEGIANIHSPFKFVKSLLRHEGYVVAEKRKKKRMSIPKFKPAYSGPIENKSMGFVFYNWLNPQ